MKHILFLNLLFVLFLLILSAGCAASAPVTITVTQTTAIPFTIPASTVTITERIYNNNQSSTTVPVTITSASTTITVPPPSTVTITVNQPKSTPPVNLPGFNRDNPISIGSTGTTTDGFQITVLSILGGAQAWDIIRQANSFNDPPETGMQYVLITVKAKNISSIKEPEYIDYSVFDLVGNSNLVYKFSDRSEVLPDEGLYSELDSELFHGGEIISSLCFYINSNETNLLLIWNNILFNRMYFQVS